MLIHSPQGTPDDECIDIKNEGWLRLVRIQYERDGERDHIYATMGIT